MSTVRFISDLHFGHEFCAKLRGFDNVLEHNEYIVAAWNSVVHKRDLTFILGDITMQTAEHYHYLNQLHGRKKVILGNHDRLQDTRELLNYVEAVGAMVKYKKCFLTHCPMHPSGLQYKVNVNIHGHSHADIIMKEISYKGKLKDVPDERYINVCPEFINFLPQTLEQLLEKNNIKL